MDVGAISNGRAAFETVRSRKPDLEPGPILVARTGLAPIGDARGSDPLEDELLRSWLRQRSILHDLDAVLSQPAPEPDERSTAEGERSS